MNTWPKLTPSQENVYINAYMSALEDGMSEQHAADIADLALEKYMEDDNG